ncbi:restriction endonuclease [Methanomassiliicoccales archaeon RumEn M1]|nr:restriction endonuclease [Methanomassiliicoccales archaeon RumEn M1]
MDDKIELNRRMNETLEAIARAIFKSWFIDFDPVRAKAEGKQPFGMDEETAAMFPSEFEDSELGEIPKGWKCGKLTDVVEIGPKRKLSKGVMAPYLDMASVPVNSCRVTDWYEREFTSGSKFIKGDVLLARITPCLENGKTAYVDFLDEGQVGWGSTEFIVLRSRAEIPAPYAYFLARSENFRSYAIQSMTGSSGRQRVPESALKEYGMVVPPIRLLQRYGDLSDRFMAMIYANSEQSRTLASIRDILLPKLLSGEIRVPMEAD